MPGVCRARHTIYFINSFSLSHPTDCCQLKHRHKYDDEISEYDIGDVYASFCNHLVRPRHPPFGESER